MKKFLWIITILALLLGSLPGCAPALVETKSNENQALPTETLTIPTPAVTSTPKWPVFLKKSAVASQEPRFIDIEEVGTFNPDIITEELRSSTQLPEASNQSLPYWTGFALENKIFVNSQDGRWLDTTSGVHYFYEEQIKFIADQGFNSARILYSLSYLSHSEDMLKINEVELEQLDELISWGMKYNVHIMLSFTGLPGKKNTTVTQENVQSNDELFRDPALQEVVQKYFVMLAKRYADIPNNNLSFELLAEPAVPNSDLNIYTQVLTPMVKSIWEVSPERVIIVDDLGKAVPEQLAALGCSLSVHNHIYTIDSRRLPEIDYKPKWPMEYLPGFFNGNGETLVLQSENGFNTGTVGMYIDEGNITIRADGKVLIDNSKGQTGWVEAAIPLGIKEIQIRDAGGYVHFQAVKIEQDDREPVILVIHDLYTNSEDNRMPTILIREDGSTQNMDDPQRILNADYFASAYLQKFLDVTEKYNVGFLMSEIGTDTQDLKADEYLAYHGEWLKALKEKNIPWMYNCLHNVMAPKSVLWLNQTSGFDDIVQIEGTPFLENRDVVEFFKTFQ